MSNISRPLEYRPLSVKENVTQCFKSRSGDALSASSTNLWATKYVLKRYAFRRKLSSSPLIRPRHGYAHNLCIAEAALKTLRHPPLSALRHAWLPVTKLPFSACRRRSLRLRDQVYLAPILALSKRGSQPTRAPMPNIHRELAHDANRVLFFCRCPGSHESLTEREH